MTAATELEILVDRQAEAAVVGALLLRGPVEWPAVAATGLATEHFGRPTIGLVFDAIAALARRGERFDPVLVTDELRRTRMLEAAGGSAKLNELLDAPPASANAPKYAAIVVDLARRRRMNELLGKATEAVRSGGDVDKLLREVEALNQASARPGEAASRLLTAGSWILDAPPGVPAVWGEGERVLWASGEPFLLCGPAGIGKTSVLQQVVLARLGVRPPSLLGLPVAPLEGDDRILYLACDRPAQIRRSFARAIGEEHRDLLDRRLVVWKGPPPSDFAKHPEILTELADSAGAGTTIVDSLKDVAVGLSDDDVGAGINISFQRAVAEGIDVAGLHHQRKGQNGAKPKTLEDVYGSTWITAGAGSVALLWGNPGDLAVEFTHLKQPAMPIGPLMLLHDHANMVTTVEEGPADPLHVLRSRPHGLTTVDLARVVGKGAEPDRNALQRARRDLERLVECGQARRVNGQAGGAGGTSAASYFLVGNDPS